MFKQIQIPTGWISNRLIYDSRYTLDDIARKGTRFPVIPYLEANSSHAALVTEFDSKQAKHDSPLCFYLQDSNKVVIVRKVVLLNINF